MNLEHVTLGILQRIPQLIIRVSGEIDLSNVVSVEVWLRAAIEGHSAVVVDMSDVAFIDGRGIDLLADLAQQLARSGRDFTVVAGRAHLTTRLLEITGLDQVVNVRPSIDR